MSLSGCAGNSHIVAESVSATESGYVGVNPSGITVFSSKKDAPKGYVVLAKLKSTDDFCCDTREQLIEAFQIKAAECGANAVIVLEVKVVPSKPIDTALERAIPNANEPSPQDPIETMWAPVTMSKADIYIPLGPKTLFKGHALAVKVPIKSNWSFGTFE